MICVNTTHPDFVNLQQVTGLNEEILKAKVGVWMEKNPSGSFPTLDDLGLQIREENTPDMFEQTDAIKENENPGFFGVKQTWDSKPETDVQTPTSKSTVTYLKRKPLNLSEEDKVKFDALVEVVGYDEAFTDVIEQNGKVRSPEYVIDKILFKNREIEDIQPELDESVFQIDQEEELVDDLKGIEEVKEIFESQNKRKATEVMMRLSNQLGVDYEVITEEEFEVMFPDAPKAAGFFMKGKVYFVAGLFNHDTVLHEFAHPIIKALSKNNPDLFNKLYSDVVKSDDGFDLFTYVQKYYPELKENSPEFMEEVMVQTMERMNKDFGYEKKSWFKELLFNIKQFLRKAFGRNVNVSKLKPDTTLRELLDMLNEGEMFELNTDFITEDDIVMFQRKYQEEVQDVLTKASLERTQQVIDDFYELVQKQVGNLTKENSIFATLKAELSDDFNEGILQTIRKNLNELSSKGTRAIKRLELYDNTTATDAEIVKHKIELFVTALANVDVVFEKLNERADLLRANQLTRDDFEVMLAMQMYIENWQNFYDNISKGYFDLYNTQDPIAQLYISSKGKLNQLSNKVKQTFSDAVFDEFYEHMKKINQPIEDEAMSELQALKDSNLYAEYERRYKQWYGLTPAEHTELSNLEKVLPANRDENRYTYLKQMSMYSQSISKEQLKALIGNTLGDVGALSSIGTGYLNSSDDIVGGFHNYISQFFNELSGNANARQAELLAKLKSKLKGTVHANKLFGENALGRAIGKKDRIINTRNELSAKEREKWSQLSVITNRTPEQQLEYERLSIAKAGFEDSEEWIFANNFKDWRADKKLLEIKIQEAKDTHTLNPTPENLKAFNKAVKLYKQWEAEYMNRDGVDEVYEFDYMMDSPIGEMAQERIDDVFTRMRMLTANTMHDPTSFDIEIELSKLWVEFRQLYSKVDANGNDKTGDELAIAELLNQYKEKTKDFYEYVDVPMKFENSFDTFLHGLDASNIQGNDRKVAIEKWIKYNTSVEIDDAYFEKRKQLVDRRNEIMADLIAVNNSIQDISGIYEKLYTDILKPTKNEAGQYSGFNLTSAQQRKATELAEEIDRAKDSYLQLSGLTGDDYKDFVFLQNKATYSTLTYQEEQRYIYYDDILKQKISQSLINFNDIVELRAIEKELREMSITESTDDYLVAFNDVVFNNTGVLDAVATEIDALFGEDIYSTGSLSKEHLEELLSNVSFLEDLASSDPSFRDFFFDNHYLAERIEYNSSGQAIGLVEKYIKSPAWTTTAPRDIAYYHTRAATTNPLSPQNGLFPNGYIELDGIPRVPNMNYRSRVIKPEFLREKIERDYIDVNPVTGAETLVIANVDNSGRWLPKTDPNDRRYIDDDYQRMFEEDRKLFDAMLMIKDHHLDNQKGLDASQKGYISYPNIRKSGTEKSLYGTLKRREGFGEYFMAKIRSIVNVFRQQADDVDFGLATPKMDEPLTRPITGLYHLNANDVSTNIIASIGLQSYSIEHYKSARKAMPFMQLFNRTIKDIAMSPEMKSYVDKLKGLNLFNAKLNGSESKRLRAIQHSLDKHLAGEDVVIDPKFIFSTGFQRSYLKLMSYMQKHASVLWFGFNAVSSTANYGSGKTLLYSRATGDNYSLNDLVMTRAKSFNTVKKLMAARYKSGEIDPLIQLLRVTDAVPDLMKKDAGTFGARTVWGDFRAGTLRFTDRKYMGDSVPVHQFLAILRHNSFEINGKKVALYDALTLDDEGRVVTIKGVPSDMKISYDSDGRIVMGEKLKKIKNVHQRIIQKNIGAVSDFNEPDAFRNIWVKTTFFIMKFIPGMLSGHYNMKFNKKTGTYGTATKNYSTQQRELGTFVGAATAIATILNSKRKLNAPQKTALYSLLILLTTNIMLRLLKQRLSHYDEDDNGENDFTFSPGEEGAHAMMKKMNGVPNLPLVQPNQTVQWGNRFSTMEWFKMNALRIVNRIIKEQESMLPVTPWDPYNSGLVASMPNLIMSGSVVGENNIFKDIIDGFGYAVNGDTYEQDAGPYIWQEGIKEGAETKWYNNKAFNLYMKYQFNLDGKIIDPRHGLKQDHTLR
ncbi:MAG: hypothetical protein RIR01_2265 [Bacteroidota bacterium]|jgi:hypothetical protein